MYSGSLPQVAAERMRARGVSPSSLALVSDMIRTAAAPSLSGQELPAVTPPPPSKASSSSASFSSVEDARGPSSFATSLPSWSETGTISRSKNPVLLGGDRELLRALRVLVHVGAAHLVALRHVDSGDPHSRCTRWAGRSRRSGFGLRSSTPAGSVRSLNLDTRARRRCTRLLAVLDRVRRVADRVEGRGAVAREIVVPVVSWPSLSESSAMIRATLNAWSPCGMPQPQ